SRAEDGVNGGTPGPWRVGEASFSARGFAQYELKGVTTLCAPDSRLIAAAPDLLAALHRLEHVAQLLGADMDEDGAVRQAQRAMLRVFVP
ncbi:MAG: hypothetical protein NT123_26410, partial [Proteobacteria bacterium]|nr:hypothetical protein [Pseudomonadota bacterium]